MKHCTKAMAQGLRPFRSFTVHRVTRHAFRTPHSQPSSPAHHFRAPISTSKHANSPVKNQIYAPIRNTDSFQTYLSLSSSSRTPLLTLWTASWCSTCRTVSPLIRSLVESGIGEEEGGISFAEIEFDSPDIMTGEPNLPLTYMITAVPTLLSFDAGEAQTVTKLSDGRKLADRQFLVEWIRNEARRHGGRGGGAEAGAGGGSIFGGLFGSRK